MTTGRLAALLLALTFAAAPVGAFSSLAGDHPKVLRAAAIFDEIVAAIGDGRTAPALRLIPAGEGGDLRVLWYDGERHVIILEESAFDVLMADADSADALAFVLGHELAHYYKDHRWTADFSHQIRDLSLGRTLQGIGNSRRKRTEIEAEADYFGGFYAHMAGYDALGAAPDALRRIYDHFELTQVASDYPSLADRQGLVHQARQGLAQLIPVFEAGVRLLLLGRYEEAARCFDFVARTFPSREILNNAGVARALEALDMFATGEVSFLYPLELDGRTRLAGGRKADRPGFAPGAFERRSRFLAQAARSLEAACASDPTFATARLNLACVADLRGAPDEALLHARRAMALAQAAGESVSLANAQLIQGIARMHIEPADPDAASKDFRAAVQGNPALAAVNLAVLRQGHAPEQKRTSPGKTYSAAAAFTNAEIDLTVRSADARCTVPAVDDGETDLVIYARADARGDYLVVDSGYQTVALRIAGETSTTHGLQRGSNVAQLTQRLGVAARLIASRQGSWHVYDDARVLVQVRSDAVRGWTAYLIQ